MADETRRHGRDAEDEGHSAARESAGERASGRPRRRVVLQRGIIVLPSAFTLGSLFFGIYAIVSATRGEYDAAAWYVFLSATLDLLDGRVARFTRTGSRFGAELDSLVDAIAFGVAPGYIVYSIFFREPEWGWIIAFVYVTATVLRLARYNIEQSGEAKRAFHGLPSPTAGMLLATYYPFSQTELFQQYLAGYTWSGAVGVGVILVSILMVSHVPYRVVPRLGFESPRRAIASSALLALFVALILNPRLLIFPLLAVYTAYGLVRAVVIGLLDRLPDRDPLLDEDDDDEVPDAQSEVRTLDYDEIAPSRRRRRLGRRRDRDTNDD